MKTFQQFCIEAYQLNEVDLKSVTSKLSNNPIVSRIANNPIVRNVSRVAGGAANAYYNRVYGLEKATGTNPNLGTIEKTLGGISAVSPPGLSQAAGLGHYAFDLFPQLRKVDRRIGKEHEKAYKTNPQAYTQMLGRSF